MFNPEILFDLTESYLASLVAGAAGNPGMAVDPSAPFGELGIDSFRVLKIIKVLESEFGTLPKTLLFEFFNVESLAKYFVDNHRQVLETKFQNQQATSPSAPEQKQPQAPVVKPAAQAPAKSVPASKVTQPPASVRPAQPVKPALSAVRPKVAVRLLEQDLPKYPALEAVVNELRERHMNEGSVSRGTRNIAPNVFIGSERKGFFNYSRNEKTILIYAYTGPDEHFAELAAEMYRHCVETNLQLSIFADRYVETVDGVPFSSTPFGALQRVLNIQEFTLEGGPMRRLRYQVSKFQKSGVCRTEEYKCGTDKAVDESIARMIEKWCETKTMVNPLIHIVKDEILAGALHPQHRLFLTYLDDKLQNAILISKMCSAMNGYLMDLEFYGKDMPLGGLEFGIANIIQTLAAEGCDMFSLGGTYGVRLETSPYADPGVDAILDDLHKQHIFNDESNLQFKNKFRPENRTIFICRPVGSGNPDTVIDVIMMIADPAKAQTSDEENHNAAVAMAEAPAPADSAPPDGEVLHIDGDLRSLTLADCGFNPLNVSADQVEFDLKTDSWAQLQMPVIDNYRRNLHARLQHPADLSKSLGAIFPFKHFALTSSGRDAEDVFCQAFERKGVVLQNLLFPTTIFHQIDKGFTPRELPQAAVFRNDPRDLYKGNLDWDLLQEQIVQAGADVAYVCVELNDNAAGGYPVAAEHLRKVKTLLKKHGIPLVVDATRVIENARFLIENEAEHAQQTVWEVVRQTLGYADVALVSLAKDFCIAGGLIASDDEQLMARVRDLIDQQGCGLDAIDKKLAALTLQDRGYIESQTAIRWEAVRRIFGVLKQNGLPVLEPAGGHCIVLDVKQIPVFMSFKHPVASFLAWVYLNTGIRGGAHNAGMQKNTAINDVVRLAIPVGLTLKQADAIADRLVKLFASMRNIPEVVIEGSADEAVGDIHARYRLVKYHNLEGTLVAKSALSMAAFESGHEQPASQAHGAEGQAGQAPQRVPTGVAIVGMAGRYPKAKNLSELWNNLLQAKDCVDEIPLERLEQRLHNRFTASYRGGFIDDVDQFDARFFSVSAHEAAILDPQERLFLEVAYEAIEDAGYYPEILSNDSSSRNIGVFVGAVWTMYQMLGAEEKIEGNNVNPTSFLWSIANRASYWLNLTGPSMTLDTACSASLTAVKLACDAIQNGECSAAIVGGVNLDLHQSKVDINSMGGSISRDGVCRSFGKGAHGYAQGEGVGALYLKPLDQAIADGDHIYGVVKSAVVAHGGRTSGYTIPSPRPQTEMILRALERANIDARSIGYIEAHGTGTELGDSIEVSGLTQAFSKYGVDKQSCPIGTVKTNIGHLEAASGIVGIQKILLQMKHRKLVPSLHASQPNENIDFPNSPFYVQQEVTDWLPKEVDGVAMPRRAGISAMGAGGTNAHIVIEEYIPEPQLPLPPETQFVERIFPLSAKTEAQLRTAATRLRDFLLQQVPPSWSAPGHFERDVAHTLRVGRKSLEFRLAVLATTREDLAEKLSCFIADQSANDVMVGHVKNADAVTGLLNAKERQDFVALIVQSGDPRRLARLWSDGVVSDWKGIATGEDGKRTPLPTYPFAHERFWIRKGKLQQQAFEPLSAPADYKLVGEKEAPVRPAPARRVDRYEFPIPSDHHALSGQISNLSAEEKTRMFVGQLMADQLGISVAEIAYDLQLMDSGITSIDMAEMTQAIKLRLDPAFSPTAFFECTTIQSLCELLGQKYPHEFEKMVVIRQTVEDTRAFVGDRPEAQSEAQSDMPRKLLHVLDAGSELALPAVVQSSVAHQGQMRCVLLTGATGFLGVHLLAELLNTDAETKVFCLVRASDKEHGLRRIAEQAEKYQLTFDTGRISVLCGDINAIRLGLSEEEWERCALEAQQILHASAHVNHIEGYATFRESAQGMKEIIRLAGTHHPKLIQFISSIAGCARKVGDEFSIFEYEDFLDDGEHVYGGYGQSKWVQETYLKRAHQHGIPYVIYRFGELSGSSRTGLGQHDDMLHRLLQMRLAIGCREKIANDVLDMLPVDFAASLVVGTGKAPELWNKIVHATHSKPYSFANLYRLAQKKGLPSAPVARDHFLSKCYEFIEYVYSINAVNGFVLECVMRDVEGSIKQRKMMDSYFAVLFPFAQDNFKRALKTLGLNLPDWSALIVQYFNAWESEKSDFMTGIRAYQDWVKSKEEQRLHPNTEALVEAGEEEIVPAERKIIELFLEGDPQ